MIKTVGELIEKLKQYPGDALIAATWESVVRIIEIYQSADGIVLIDADEENYKNDFVSGRIKARGYWR